MQHDSRPKTTAAPRASGQPARFVLDEQIGFMLRIATQRHTSIFMSRMIEGLTPTQFAALVTLLELGPCSQNHLGRLIYLDTATIKGVVDRLRMRGFVATTADPKDRRRRAVALTDAGQRIAADAIDATAEITARTLSPLTAQEQRTMIDLLKKLG